jgi:hypothetical protein
MTTIPTRTFTHKAAARAAIIAAATGFGAVALASPALAGGPLVINKYIEVPNCVGHSQTCPLNPNDAPVVNFTTTTPTINVNFTANANHCASMVAHIFVDGREWGSNTVGPGENDGGYEIPVANGNHRVAVQAQGLPGGCNSGFVSAWGGVLHIEELPA